MGRAALFTLVLGDRYREVYRREFFPSQERFARALGVPLIVRTTPLPHREGPPHTHPSWQKLLLFEAEELAGFDTVGWIDADIFAMRGAMDPFALAVQGWLAVDNNTCGNASQAQLDREWYWFLREADRPSRLLNSGLFVVRRELHADLLRAVHDAYPGHWDQGPFSFHLLEETGGLIGPPELNRVVVHHLGVHGAGPAAMRRLVEPPGLIHFASGTALNDPSHLAFVQRYDQRPRATRVELGPTQVRSAIRAGAVNGVIKGIRGALRVRPELAPSVVSWIGKRRGAHLMTVMSGEAEIQRHLLRRALTTGARLHINAHRSHLPGWVTVDPLNSGPSSTHDTKFADSGGATFRLPVQEALQLAPRSSLRQVFLENVLEPLAHAARVEVLRAASLALAPGGSLQLSALERTTMSWGPERFHRVLARRACLDLEQVQTAADAAGVRLELARTGTSWRSLELGDARHPVPRGSITGSAET